MKLTYQMAIFGFCSDLTDPSATSRPVGVLLLAQGAGVLVPPGAILGLAALALCPHKDDNLDPLSKAIQSNLDRVLKDQIARAINSHPGKTIGELMAVVHDGLRNSLHVSEVTEEESLDLEETANLSQVLADTTAIASRRLAAELGGVLLATALPQEESRASVTSLPAQLVLPMTYGWPLASQGELRA